MSRGKEDAAEHEPATDPYSCYEKVTTILKLNQPFEEVDS
jgi:hypothetical protein